MNKYKYFWPFDFNGYADLFPAELNPIYIPKNRHWAAQRRAAKKRKTSRKAKN